MKRILAAALDLILLSTAQPAFAQLDQISAKFPPELVRFTPYRGNPVFAAAPGQWDARIRERGWIMREGGIYKLWYTGYDGTVEGLRMLGYATSSDGIHWTRSPRNPLRKDVWIEDMMIVKHDGTYFMFAEGRNDRAHMLTSKNGIDWDPVGKLDIHLQNGQPIPDGPYGTPTVWLENGIWHLFYERNDLGIWLATSRDTKVWRNVQDAPVLTPGPAVYDKDRVALNQIIKHKGRYYAYYHGSAKSAPGKGLWSTAVATSTDLIHWERYPNNPLTPPAANRSSGIVLPEGDGFRLYTMHPEVNLYLPQESRTK
jgi:beta-1,2-mannobiose phosphorylase / 1,2-beta-oligomannan phosphorylase